MKSLWNQFLVELNKIIDPPNFREKWVIPISMLAIPMVLSIILAALGVPWFQSIPTQSIGTLTLYALGAYAFGTYSEERRREKLDQDTLYRQLADTDTGTEEEDSQEDSTLVPK
jgi:hypothetical protein